MITLGEKRVVKLDIQDKDIISKMKIYEAKPSDSLRLRYYAQLNTLDMVA